MVKTKFTGVYYRENQSGDKIFYIKGKIKGKSYIEKVGSYSEGVSVNRGVKLGRNS